MSKNVFIKLLVCYHKKDTLLKDEILTPIHVGRDLAIERNVPDLAWLQDNMIGDNTGDNISYKNSSYNELTALYWAWKNYDKIGNPDFVGLMHYRRHFIFRKSNAVVETVNDMDENYFDYINYNDYSMAHLFDDCDFVAHIGRVDQIYKHYDENHHIEDLELALDILKEKYPEYSDVAQKYLKKSNGNFCNMFILPRAQFFNYCQWIFSILFEFEKRVDLSEKRLFISERLTGIFLDRLVELGLRQKSLSTTFINSDMKVPVAIPYIKDNVFSTAVTIDSIIRNKRKGVSVSFYLLTNEDHAYDFSYLLSAGDSLKVINCSKELKAKGYDVNYFDFPESYSMIVSDIIEDVNKILYVDEKTLFFGDVGNVYQTCNNDEFFYIGAPSVEADNCLRKGTCCLNAKLIRKHKILSHAYENKKVNSIENWLSVCTNYKVFPWWLYNVCNSENLLFNNQTRRSFSNNIWQRPMLIYYDGFEPWNDMQNSLARFWWEVAFNIKGNTPFDCVTEETFVRLSKQSEYVSYLNEQGKIDLSKNKSESNEKISRSDNYESKNNIFKRLKVLIKKALSFYRKNGLKMTVHKVVYYLKGKKK